MPEACAQITYTYSIHRWHITQRTIQDNHMSKSSTSLSTYHSVKGTDEYATFGLTATANNVQCIYHDVIAWMVNSFSLLRLFLFYWFVDCDLQYCPWSHGNCWDSNKARVYSALLGLCRLVCWHRVVRHGVWHNTRSLISSTWYYSGCKRRPVPHLTNSC